MSLAKRPSHVVPLRPCAMRALLAHLSHLPGFNTEHSCVFVGILYLQMHTVLCTAIFGPARSDRIMGGVRQEDVEAFLHVTVVAIHADWNSPTIPRPRDDMPHKIKRDVLLHSLGTHPVEEQCVTLAVTMRRGVLNNMSSEILNSAVPRETCRWPTVCPRSDHPPTA